MSSPGPRRALPEFAQAHLERYLATDGEDGHIWQGVPTLLLTTTGRKSGEPLQLPLIYGEDGDRLLVVASKGGAPDHPSWYKNLVANPEVQIQRKEEEFAAQARTAGPEEHQRLWAIMAKIWPAYDQYQARTERRIPVVIIER